MSMVVKIKVNEATTWAIDLNQVDPSDGNMDAVIRWLNSYGHYVVSVSGLASFKARLEILQRDINAMHEKISEQNQSEAPDHE